MALARWGRRVLRRSALAALVALAVPMPFTACSPQEKNATTPARPGEKRYPLRGVVLSANPAERTLRVRHEEIPGYMPAMTMDFLVSAGDAANAREGQRIRAELVEYQGEYSLERIWPADTQVEGAVEAAAKAIMQDTVSRGRDAYREVGEQTPDFTLLDQEGRVVESTRFRGKQVMINFIFTRCPVATMCPAAVARFQTVQRLAKEKGVRDFELISISLDPTYDTPGVLKTYTQERLIDTSNYTFLTGPETAIKSLLAQFGVLTEMRGDLLNHTLATVLVDPAGRIVHRADGSSWPVADFVDRLRVEEAK